MTAIASVEPLIVPRPASQDEILYEIIDGRRVDLPPMSILAAFVATKLAGLINAFGMQHPLGRAVVEGLFLLPPPVSRMRRPDVAFVSFQRWAANKQLPQADNAWEVVPDLAIEVVSPTDLAEKIEEYFLAGVLQVWVVFPRRRVVHVYESPQTIRGLTIAGELVGGTILPGFQVPLKSLFE
jgi:Uma2 family endonuclease